MSDDAPPAAPADNPGTLRLVDAPPARPKKPSGAQQRRARAEREGAAAGSKSTARPARPAPKASGDLAMVAESIAMACALLSATLMAKDAGQPGGPWARDAELISGAGPKLGPLVADVIQRYPALMALLSKPAEHSAIVQLAWELAKLGAAIRANHATNPATPKVTPGEAPNPSPGDQSTAPAHSTPAPPPAFSVHEAWPASFPPASFMGHDASAGSAGAVDPSDPTLGYQVPKNGQ